MNLFFVFKGIFVICRYLTEIKNFKHAAILIMIMVSKGEWEYDIRTICISVNFTQWKC